MEEKKFKTNEIFRCPKCKIVLAERAEPNTVRILKYKDGKPFYVDVKVDHSAGGVVYVKCEKCNRDWPYMVTLVLPKEVCLLPNN